MVETASDRLIMLSDFGEDVVFTPVGGNASTIKAIFDNVYQSVEAGGTVGFALTQPKIMVRTTDVPSIAEGDNINLRSTDFTVRVVMQDGTGMTEIGLEA